MEPEVETRNALAESMKIRKYIKFSLSLSLANNIMKL